MHSQLIFCQNISNNYSNANPNSNVEKLKQIGISFVETLV